MIHIEVRGIPCAFNEGSMNDFDMLQLMDRLTDGDIVALAKFARGVFGEEQLENIKDSLRGDDGVCKLTDMSAFVNEAIVEASKAKRTDPKN